MWRRPYKGGNQNGDWLVDPNEWYTPEERERRGGGTAASAGSEETSRETSGTPADEPVSTEWKLLTPEDMAQPTAPQSAPTAPSDGPSEPEPQSNPPMAVVDEQSAAVEPAPSAEPPSVSPSVKTPRINAAPESPTPPDITLPPAGDTQTPNDVSTAAPLFDPPHDSESRTTLPIAPPALPDVELIESPPQQEALPPPKPTDGVSDADALFEPPVSHQSPPTSEILPPPPEADPPPNIQHQAPSIQHPASGIQQPAQIFPAPTTPEPTDPHIELFAKNAYPSARECATCHEDIYHEWSMSAHAYAAVSPMFHKFEQKLNDLSHGTVGYFCMRCHAPVATALCASRAEPLWNLPEVAREGITCIACHRVQYVYGKSNGERRIEPGDVFAPVFGGIGGDGVAETIHRREHFKVKTSPDEPGPGQNMHVAGIYFEPLTRSEFCTPCHQVAVHPGIKLEVVWEQYRASPACKKGIQCQDCHMGRVPGLPLGYNVGPVAKIAGKTVNDQRKRSNHIFYGPNYSIAHPGVFPFHLKGEPLVDARLAGV